MRLILSLAALFLSVILLQLSSGGVGPLDALTGLEQGFSKGQIEIFAFSWLFHRLLVGTTHYGQRWTFPSLCSLHLYGCDWYARSYFINRPNCLGCDAGGFGLVRRRMLHGDRSLAASKGDQPQPGPHYGCLPGGRYFRILGCADDDWRFGDS